MARSLTSGVIGQLLSSHIRLVFFVAAVFVSGPVYVWNGLGDTSWNSQTWTGIGNLLSISTVSEASDISAKNITLTLSAIPSDLLGKTLTEVRQGNPVTIWLGFLDSNGAVIADPYQSFNGHMDVPTISEGVLQSTIEMTCENPLIDMNRSPNRRFTQDDQKTDYPTDNGFIWVPAIQTWNGVWGKAGPGGTPSGGTPSLGSGSSSGSSGTGTGSGGRGNKGL